MDKHSRVNYVYLDLWCFFLIWNDVYVYELFARIIGANNKCIDWEVFIFRSVKISILLLSGLVISFDELNI